jgi:F0F1-type ATP synthase delta subunit
MIRRFARPYARAIMDVAGSPEKAAALRDELTQFEAVRKSSNDLQLMYANPGIDHDSKTKVTAAIACSTCSFKTGASTTSPTSSPAWPR